LQARLLVAHRLAFFLVRYSFQCSFFIPYRPVINWHRTRTSFLLLTIHRKTTDILGDAVCNK